MGWWDCDVLGGDKPLDIQGNMIDKAGGKELYMQYLQSKRNPELKKQLAAKLREAYENGSLRTIAESGKIAMQVYGAVIMEYGLPVTQEEKEKIIDAVYIPPPPPPSWWFWMSWYYEIERNP